MSLVDRVRGKTVELTDREREDAVKATREVPRDVQERVQRGRKEMMVSSRKRRLCMLMLDGEQYAYLDNNGALARLETNRGVTGGKPAHRIRNRHNFIRPAVDAKVSSSTTRPPGYEVNPTTTDPEDAAASKLAEKLCRQGWEKWGTRRARVKAATLAIGGGGKAYALPYFDPMVGPFRIDEDENGEPRLVGEGEIKQLILNGNEAYCEPGTDWEESRWYGVETARPISEVQAMPRFNGAKLEGNASTADVPSDKPTEDMVMVTLYFERPCPKYPQGRMLTMACGQQICPPEPYPLRKGGQAIDEPCIHRLVYRMDPRRDDDLGLTWELIDFQTSINDCDSKILELKNLALLPQIMAAHGSIKKAPTDEPGGLIYYHGSVPPQWREPPNPALLQQLQAIRAGLLEDMRYVSADAEISVAPNVAIGTVQAAQQQANNRWSQFIDSFAAWDATVARHCLLLAQEHYTEERVLKVRGRMGWEPEASFRGADILGQTDVWVNAATIETRSRQQMLQTLAWIQANFPGYIRPEIAIEIALNGAALEGLIERFEADKARVNMIINKIIDGSILGMPSRLQMMPGPPMPAPPDPATGMPTGPPVPGPEVMLEVPGWMPRKFDDVPVQLYVYESWLKTDDAAQLPPEFYEVAMLVYDGFKQIEADQAAQAAAAQSAQAMELGEKNAANPQEPKPMPSTPSPNGSSKETA